MVSWLLTTTLHPDEIIYYSTSSNFRGSLSLGGDERFFLLFCLSLFFWQPIGSEQLKLSELQFLLCLWARVNLLLYFVGVSDAWVQSKWYRLLFACVSVSRFNGYTRRIQVSATLHVLFLSFFILARCLLCASILTPGLLPIIAAQFFFFYPRSSVVIVYRGKKRFLLCTFFNYVILVDLTSLLRCFVFSAHGEKKKKV